MNASRFRPRFRLSLRTMHGLVALIAVGLGVWAAYFDPVRRWQRAFYKNSQRRFEVL